MLSTRNIMIAANWKMNLNVLQASMLVRQLQLTTKKHQHIEMVLAPTMLTLQPVSSVLDKRKFKLAAQNGYFKDEGAYTGEVSFSQLRGLADYCIIGHSERRIHFKETLKEVEAKVAAAFRNDVVPILCVGETKYERSQGETKQVIYEQLVSALAALTSDQVEQIVIAYEPVWAISTFGGELAKPREIARMVKFIREQIGELYGVKAAKAVRILYGGSVDDQIVRGYLEVEGVDGALVGGASLNAHKFAAMVESAFKLQADRRS